MRHPFLQIAATPSVQAAQIANGSHVAPPPGEAEFDGLTPLEAAFITERDSFYLASVSETGWPYVQHRGGPAGFLHVLDPATLAMLDFRGNRQYISLGNATANDRVALFLMDYARRTRLKLYARLEVVALDADRSLAAALDLGGYRARPERAFRFHVAAYDWNCPQHITPRFTAAQVEAATAPLRERLAELEAENRNLREAAAR